MDRQKFDEVIQVTVQYIAKGLMARHPNMGWRTNWQEELFQEYEKQRLAIRNKMQLPADLTNHRIDRHKIASAMALAILGVRPIDPKTDTSAGARLANEFLAISSGGAIVWRFVVEGIKKNRPKDAQKYSGTKFSFPPSSDCPYTTHACKMLHHHPDGGGDLVLANMFFLLEACHLRTLESKHSHIDPTPDEIKQASI